MSIQQQVPQQLIAGYAKMRTGTLLLFVSWILMGVGLLFLFGGTLTGDIMGAITGAVIYAILVLVGLIVALVGFVGFFISGVSMAASVRSEYRTAASLLKIGFRIGLLLLVLGFIILIAGAVTLSPIVLLGFLLFIVSGILVFIGYIGLIILCFKLNSVENISLFLIAGILFIIGLFVPVLPIISWILMYIGLGEAIRRAQAPLATAPAYS